MIYLTVEKAELMTATNIIITNTAIQHTRAPTLQLRAKRWLVIMDASSPRPSASRAYENKMNFKSQTEMTIPLLRK